MGPPDDAAPATDEAVEAIEAVEAARRDWLAATDERIAALGQRAARFSAFPPGEAAEVPRALRTEPGFSTETLTEAAARWGRTPRRRGRGGVS